MNNIMLLVFASDLLCANGDIENFVRVCAENGATGIRIFACETAIYNPVTLWTEIERWNAGYPGEVLPLYNLELPNPEGWNRFHLFLKALKKYNLKLVIDFHDFCSLKKAGAPKFYYPWRSNIQCFPDRDVEHSRIPGGFWTFHAEWRRLQSKFVRQIVNAINVEGVNALYSVMNEYSIIGWGEQPTRSWDWYKWFLDIMVEAGISRGNTNASNPTFQDRKASEVITRKFNRTLSLHGFVKVKPINTYGLPHQQLIISGDGGIDGSGDADAKGRKGLGNADAKKLAEYIKIHDFAGYEYMSLRIYSVNPHRANLDLFNPEPLRIMAEILGTIQPPPPPPPPPPEDKKEEIYKKLDEIKGLVEKL